VLKLLQKSIYTTDSNLRMKKIFYFILALLSNTISGQESEKQQVRLCFSRYKEAILLNNGLAAAKHLDTNTRFYYQKMAEMIKFSDSAQVDSSNILDKTLLLMVRHLISYKDLNTLTGPSLFVFAVDAGLVGKENLKQNNIAKVDLDSNFAKGQHAVNGMGTSIYYDFFKEGKDWKIDLTSIFDIALISFENVVALSNQSTNEFIFGAIQLQTGATINNSIWHPAFKR